MKKSILPLILILAGCAPQTFIEQGVTFRPVPRQAINALTANVPHDYRADAIALRGPNVVWYADDMLISRDLVNHEIKHFRRDPASPTGYCEHQSDGKTWIHEVCK